MPKIITVGIGSKVVKIRRGSEGGKARHLQREQERVQLELTRADDPMDDAAAGGAAVSSDASAGAQRPAEAAAAAAPSSGDLEPADYDHDHDRIDWRVEASDRLIGDGDSYHGYDYEFDAVDDAFGQHQVDEAVERAVGVAGELAARPQEFDDPLPEGDGIGGDWDAGAESERVPLALTVPLADGIPVDGVAALPAQAEHAPAPIAPPAANAPPIDPDFAFDPRFRLHDSLANQQAPSKRQVCQQARFTCSVYYFHFKTSRCDLCSWCGCFFARSSKKISGGRTSLGQIWFLPHSRTDPGGRCGLCIQSGQCDCLG